MLLSLGLSEYGSNDLVSIKSHFLLSKPISKIHSRIRQSCERKTHDNPIKDFQLLPFKPMNFCERFILVKLIKKYATKSRQYFKLLFPHIPDSMIMKEWEGLVRIGVVEKLPNTKKRELSTYRKDLVVSPNMKNVYVGVRNNHAGKLRVVPLGSNSTMNLKADVKRDYIQSLNSMPETVYTSPFPNSPLDESTQQETLERWNSDFETDNEKPMIPKVSFANLYDTDSEPEKFEVKVGSGRGGTKKKRRVQKDVIVPFLVLFY